MKKYILLSILFIAIPSVMNASVTALGDSAGTAVRDSVIMCNGALRHTGAVCDSDSMFAYQNPVYLKKHFFKAGVEAFGLNVAVQSFDRFVLNADYAQISFHTIRHNISYGFVWDNDQFSTNLFAHPYHGGLYFNCARSNGLSFFESVPYAFCGSLMWETTCEIEPPAINDLLATTMGGICIGEVTHRLSDLVYDDRTYGFSRFLREALGAIVCPMRELNRLLSGDAWRIRHSYYKYHNYNRLPVDFAMTVGNRYLADKGGMFRGESNPFLDLSLVYGDPFNEEENKPYDFFTANVTLGLSGNQPLVNQVHLCGRLWGTPINTGTSLKTEFGIFQHFNYYDSSPVKDGSNTVPFRISEAAAFGPGIIYSFPKVGNLAKLVQQVYVDGILLGGSLTDYYNVIDRDYNMGSGYSIKTNTYIEFENYGRFAFTADYYHIYTWKGYENKDLSTIDPIYLNAQGDKSDAALLVLRPRIEIDLVRNLQFIVDVAYYFRTTYYKYHDTVSSHTFAARLGFAYHFR